MSDSNILQAFTQGFDSVKSMFHQLDGKMDTVQNQNGILQEQNETLKNQLEETTSKLDEATDKISDLEAKILKLEKQQNQDSSNSHWPFSVDKIKKKKVIKSLREKTELSVGGQVGHKGSTLKFSENPNEIITINPHNCSACGTSLEIVIPSKKVVRRQVFDLPTPELYVTEYQKLTKICPVCGQHNQGEFPEHVLNNTQYGPHLTALVAYLHHFQMIPFKRLSDLFADLFGQGISQGTLVSMVKRVHEALEPAESFIKSQLIDSKVDNFDETGCYVEDKRWWLHVASNANYTHFGVDPSRGQEATDKIGILPNFKGTGVHDNWGTYFRYDFNHALCNVHHLRELKSIEERFEQEWATQMRTFLLEAKAYSETHPYPLIPMATQRFVQRFEEIIAIGKAENPEEKSEKFRDAQNLLWRFENRQEEILEFLYQEEVPFSNNRAESDIRMTKVKQKVSGTFRTSEGANHFARIRGFMSTCQKQSVHILNGVYDCLVGNPSPIQ